MARSRSSRARPPASPLLKLGLPSLRQTSGHVYEEWRPRLVGGQRFKVFREMGESDTTAGGFINNLVNFLNRAPSLWEPAKPIGESDASPSPEAQRIADRMAGAWEDMDETPRARMSTVIEHTARDGAAPMEVTYKVCRGDVDDPMFASDYNDGWLAWRSWDIRPLESVDRWEWSDDKRELLGFWQSPQETRSLVWIPMSKVVHFRFRHTKNNPEGLSMLSLAERAYYFKRIFEELEAIGIKRDLTGMPVMEVPPKLFGAGASADEQETLRQMKELVTLVERDGLEGVVIPAELDPDGNPTQFRFRLMASGGSRQVNTSDVIRRIRGEMSVGLGAAFMYAGMDGVGAKSLDESKTDAFRLQGDSLLGALSETINVEAARMLRLNGVPRALWPTHRFGDIDKASLQEWGAYVSSLMTAGGLTYDEALEAEIRRRGELPAKEVRDDAYPPLRLVDEQAQAPAAAPVVDPSAEPVPAAETALNGAQVTSAVEIVGEVAAGRLPRSTGVAMLQEFFNLDPARAERIMGEVGRGFVPADDASPSGP